MDIRSLFARVLTVVFALNRPRDWLIKPVVFLLVVNILYFSLETRIMGAITDQIWRQMLLVSLVASPFVLFGFGAAGYFLKIQNQLAHLALTDALTGLPNRRAFIEKTARAMAAGHHGYLMIIDADFFKRVNDTYGHAVGDACLMALAERMQEVMDEGELTGRVGGEEFAAYLPRDDRDRLVEIGKSMTRTIYVPFEPEQDPIPLTVSIGATPTAQEDTVTDALQRADEALYHAKRKGRARMMVGPRSVLPPAA